MKTIKVDVMRVYGDRGKVAGEPLKNAGFEFRVESMRDARHHAVKTFKATHGDEFKPVNCNWKDRETLLLYCMKRADIPSVRPLVRRRALRSRKV